MYNIVPIHKLLKEFLQTDNIFQEIMKHIIEVRTNWSVSYSSMFNASLWKKISSKFDNKILLPIIMYYDDFECDNPLGTQAGIHKLGGIYFTIGGIPPQFSSRLENIFLWGLFYSADKVAFGNAAILNRFFIQLQDLENNGITVLCNGESKTVYFTLFALLGDNLGVNSLTGMSDRKFSSYILLSFLFCK